MDYEKKYKDALEIMEQVRKSLTKDSWVQPEIIKAFPELAEDDKIRKELIWHFKGDGRLIDPSGKTDSISYKDIRAWLEKQGKQNTLDDTGNVDNLHNYLYGEQKPVDSKPHLPDGSILYDRRFEEAQEYLTKRGFDIPWNDCDIFIDERYITQTIANVLTWADEHPKEQKQEWSEEDENHRKDAILAIQEYRADCIKKYGKDPAWADCVDWLEALKERYIPQPKQEWKPSEEQMRALMDSTRGLYACKDKTLLLDLYEQLKAL